MTDLDRVLDDLPERRKDIASRLRELHHITSDDPDEPDLALRAVASLVRFLRASNLREPELAAGDGRILAQWDDPGIGLLALEFREDDHVEFALATGGESGEPIRVRRSGGPAPVAHCLDFVRRMKEDSRYGGVAAVTAPASPVERSDPSAQACAERGASPMKTILRSEIRVAGGERALRRHRLLRAA